MTTLDVGLVWTMTTRTMKAQCESTTGEAGLIRKMTTRRLEPFPWKTTAQMWTPIDDDVQRARTGE